MASPGFYLLQLGAQAAGTSGHGRGLTVHSFSPHVLPAKLISNVDQSPSLFRAERESLGGRGFCHLLPSSWSSLIPASYEVRRRWWRQKFTTDASGFYHEPQISGTLLQTILQIP